METVRYTLSTAFWTLMALSSPIHRETISDGMTIRSLTNPIRIHVSPRNRRRKDPAAGVLPLHFREALFPILVYRHTSTTIYHQGFNILFVVIISSVLPFFSHGLGCLLFSDLGPSLLYCSRLNTGKPYIYQLLFPIITQDIYAHREDFVVVSSSKALKLLVSWFPLIATLSKIRLINFCL